jgi:hypothetical protein
VVRINGGLSGVFRRRASSGARAGSWRGQQRFLTRLGNALCRPHLVLGQALQHLVAGTLGALRMAVGAQPAGCLGQHRQQRRLGRRQVFR